MFWELAAGVALWPLLQKGDQGDGHPVLVLPGLMANDGSTILLRRFLTNRGYDARGWGLGLNLGPRKGVEANMLALLDELCGASGQKVIASKRFEAFGDAGREMKNELYRIACLDKPAFLALMRRHDYPSIQSAKAGAFITDVEAFLNVHSPRAANLPTGMLKEMVRKAKGLTELPFLEGDNPDVLIGSFSSFFTTPILLFEKATHVFDREIQVEKSLNAGGFKQRAQGIDYRFSDSKADPGIQLADVVVGLIGKYQDFVEEHRLPELLARKKYWSARQTETFDLLRGLIDYSDDVSNAFIHRITAMDSEWKNDSFMHDIAPMPHLL